MKKRRLLPLALLVAVAGCVVAARLWPRTLSDERCGELYRAYADNPEVKASFVKDFRVNDTVVADVTLLKALSDTGWALLQKDFNIYVPEEEDTIFLIDVYFWKTFPKSHPSLPPDSNRLNNDIAAYSYPRRVVGVFSIKDEKQMKAIPYFIADYNMSNN